MKLLEAGSKRVYYLFHVDDIICVSNDDELRDMCFAYMKRKMKIRDEGEPDMFLGMKISRDVCGGFKMSQKHYIERMADRFHIDSDTKKTETPGQYNLKMMKEMCPETDDEKKDAMQLPFQSLVGGLIYCTKTRPDVAYAISDIARFMGCWGVKHFKAALRILRYLYSTRDTCLCIMPDGDLDLTCYCDANWGDDRGTGEKVDDKWKSQYGYIMLLGNVPVAWCSKRQHSRAFSSMEAEFYAASEAAKEVKWFRRLLSELDCKQTGPTVIYEDNKACIAYSKNNTCHERTKHIDIRAYALRDFVREGCVELVHIKTNDQLADMMTKTQLKYTFLEHKNRIFSGVKRRPEIERLKKKKVGMCVCLTCFIGGASCVIDV